MNKRKLLGQQIYFGSECVTSFEKQLFKKWLWKLEWLKKKRKKRELLLSAEMVSLLAWIRRKMRQGY